MIITIDIILSIIAFASFIGYFVPMADEMIERMED